MSRKVTRQSRVSMERITAAANSRLMRLAQRMIVGGALFLDRVANSQRNTIRGNVERIEPAPSQILSRTAFDLMVLSADRHWVVSIREEEANPIPQPEFSGNRINLAFYDLMDGPNIATASHIEKVYRFS